MLARSPNPTRGASRTKVRGRGIHLSVRLPAYPLGQGESPRGIKPRHCPNLAVAPPSWRLQCRLEAGVTAQNRTAPKPIPIIKQKWETSILARLQSQRFVNQATPIRLPQAELLDERLLKLDFRINSAED